jgi:hypothetical protein
MTLRKNQWKIGTNKNEEKTDDRRENLPKWPVSSTHEANNAEHFFTFGSKSIGYVFFGAPTNTFDENLDPEMITLGEMLSSHISLFDYVIFVLKMVQIA